MTMAVTVLTDAATLVGMTNDEAEVEEQQATQQNDVRTTTER